MESDCNATPDFTPGAAMRIPEGKEAIEEADEELDGRRDPVSKFELNRSLMHSGKGKTNQYASSPIHSVCTTAITTQEGSNAAREWNDKRQETRDSSTKKQNKSRKNRQVHARKKRNGTSKAVADILDSPGPMPEALVGVKLRLVEENQPVDRPMGR